MIVGAGLICIVETRCKKAWGLSSPVSIGWIILTAFAMLASFFLVLFIQIDGLSPAVLFVFVLIYSCLSVIILYKKYTKVKKAMAKINLLYEESMENIFDDDSENDDEF